MPLAFGDRLGHYEILAPLGKGGMGEVYRARDTQLDREAAIKILPAALAHDPEGLARFEREARVLASLNHPNIAQVYGIAEGGGVRGIAMELVPGENISGPLPVETVIGYARQIASALDAAHERGFVHRDLKPANIMVTPDGVVKVLDFGLARLSAAESEDPSESPTTMASPTRAGIILGTAGYMSPEQARGKVVDKRVDIWAFGVVVYETATGKRLFEGETISDILAGALKEEPDLSLAPVKLRRLLRRCLQKNPKSRLRDIGDWSELLEEGDGAVHLRAKGRPVWWMGTTAAVTLAAGTLAFVHFRETPAQPAVQRVEVLTEKLAIYPAISPDGKQIAYVRTDDGVRRLYLRPLDSLESRFVPGTDGALYPFWSADSRNMGFFAGGKLKR